jgi:hypothetical protein
MAKRSKFEPIKDIEHLRKLASRPNGVHCFIALNGGLRSSKDISYLGNTWKITNYIDGTMSTYKLDRNFKKWYPFLFKALEQGCLIQEVSA